MELHDVTGEKRVPLPSNKEKLNRFHDPFSGSDPVLITINADPDAMASAMAVKRLLWRRVAGVTISNINAITWPDNMAMIRLLDVPLTHITWSVISGIHEDKLIIVVRNDGARKAAGALMANKFGKFGSAGGHRSMTRAEAQLSLLDGQVNVHDEPELLEWIIAKFENKRPHAARSRKK